MTVDLISANHHRQHHEGHRMNNIDALAASDEIKSTYRRYLSLLAVRDPALTRAACRH